VVMSDWTEEKRTTLTTI